MSSHLDHLDDIARQAFGKRGTPAAFEPLSTGEQLYVALAANRADLLKQCRYTVAQALARLDDDWTAELVRRWRHFR